MSEEISRNLAIFKKLCITQATLLRNSSLNQDYPDSIQIDSSDYHLKCLNGSNTEEFLSRFPDYQDSIGYLWDILELLKGLDAVVFPLGVAEFF